MENKSLTLDLLLETHDQPFIIINASLIVIAVNKAWEICFGIVREQQIGKPCCVDNSECRHKKGLQQLEPYEALYSDESLSQQNSKQLKVRGYPLLDDKGVICIGESITPSKDLQKQKSPLQMIGMSVAFSNLKGKIEQAAQVDIPAILLGETGTGKEVAAAYLHQHSNRAINGFVIVDCTILTGELFESELFGHEKGAFTGATARKEGLFQHADKGTLFLDEIGELPLSLQPKLLRALESGQYRRLGSNETHHADVRVICATHRNLADMVKAGTFREDLFYRLSVFSIHLPPLRERMQDIPLLADYLLQQVAKTNGGTYTLTRDALIKLMKHQWPGNIRELRNCMQLAAGLCKNYLINEDDIHISQAQQTTDLSMIHVEENNEPSQTQSQSNESLNPMEKIESDFITQLIKKYSGNRKKMATEMNVSERTLYRKLKRLNLNTAPVL